MTNPISTIPNAQLPHPNQALVDQGGVATQLFYRFLMGLWQRTGGGPGIDNSNTEIVAKAALETAQQAERAAHTANVAVTANTAQIAALQTGVIDASTKANQAQTTASTSQTASLQKFNNLGDIFDKNIARTNLGLDRWCALYAFDTLPVGLRRGVVIHEPMILKANLLDTQVWWDVAPHSDAVFRVSYVRNGVETFVGTVTIAANGTGVQFSLQGAVSLLAGDALVVQCPSPVDTTLARVALNFPLVIS